MQIGQNTDQNLLQNGALLRERNGASLWEWGWEGQGEPECELGALMGWAIQGVCVYVEGGFLWQGWEN